MRRLTEDVTFFVDMNSELNAEFAQHLLVFTSQWQEAADPFMRLDSEIEFRVAPLDHPSGFQEETLSSVALSPRK